MSHPTLQGATLLDRHPLHFSTAVHTAHADERHRNPIGRTGGHAQTGGSGRAICGTGVRGLAKTMTEATFYSADAVCDHFDLHKGFGGGFLSRPPCECAKRPTIQWS